MQASMDKLDITMPQLTRLTLAINELKEYIKLPYIVLFTDPTAGGITASYAMVGPIFSIAEPGALIAFAGATSYSRNCQRRIARRVSELVNMLKRSGFVDLIVKRKDL